MSTVLDLMDTHMKKIYTTVITATLLGTLAPTAHAKTEIWNCPDGEHARKSIISGDIESWPHYTPGPGIRVQKQYPNTALSAQAKYIEANGTSGAICQYYNHIGFVATIYAIGATKHKTDKNSYWREEYIESAPEQDNPDRVMMDVCMGDKSDLSYQSVSCSFLVTTD